MAETRPMSVDNILDPAYLLLDSFQDDTPKAEFMRRALVQFHDSYQRVCDAMRKHAGYKDETGIDDTPLLNSIKHLVSSGTLLAIAVVENRQTAEK